MIYKWHTRCLSTHGLMKKKIVLGFLNRVMHFRLYTSVFQLNIVVLDSVL